MTTKLLIEKIFAGDFRGPAVLTFLFEDSSHMTPDQASIDRRYKGILKDVLKSGQFRGERFELYPLSLVGPKGSRRLLLVGLGKEEKFQPNHLRLATAAAVQSLLASGITDPAATFLDPKEKLLAIQYQAQLLAEGALLGAYNFDAYQTEKKDRPAAMTSMTLLSKDLPPIPIRNGMQWGQTLAGGSNYARTLGNHPPNVATPEFLAREAQEMAKRYSSLRCQVLERAEIEKLGMGAFLSVNRGSADSQPLKLIHLEYRGQSPRGRGSASGTRRSRRPRIGLIGKGITFDSGGINLKPSKSIEEMKYDMCGAAAVLGAVRALAEASLPIDVVALIPTTENMPSGKASHPSDIVKSMSGKTVEILNTDAEGRLILCDTLTYIQRQNVDAIIDFATLTGAVVVALGEEASGLLSNNDPLVAQLEAAGDLSGERLWRLPLWPEYHEQLKSKTADMKNIGNGNAGAITAACFLEKFVENKPWAHVDIAGTAWFTEKKPGRSVGATGVGVRLALEFLKRFKPLR